MSDNIPYEIQAGIIRNLPIKSLIRFRLVSNQWKSLIDSSRFIVEYQTYQKHRHHLLVRFQSYYKPEEKYVSIVDDDTFPQHKFSLTVPTSLSLLKGPDIVSSQGLLFLHRYDIYSGTRKALIWNPTLRKAVDIDLCCPLNHNYFVFSFGVRPDTCDPMIVKFPYNPYSYERAIFEVFTLSTNAWRRLSKNLPRERISFKKKQVAIDRFMYWFAHGFGNQSWNNSRNLIVSFDMTSEEFTEINLPDSLAVDQESIVSLSSISESLIIVKIEADLLLVSVWKMMELGVSKSFAKLYTIDSTYGINAVHGFRKSGEPIVQMRNDPENGLFAYEPDSKHINYIGISGAGQLFSAVSYIETLLLLDH